MAHAFIHMQKELHQRFQDYLACDDAAWYWKARMVRMQHKPVIKDHLKTIHVRYPNKMKTVSGDVYVLQDSHLDVHSGHVVERWVHFQDKVKQKLVDSKYEKDCLLYTSPSPRDS